MPVNGGGPSPAPALAGWSQRVEPDTTLLPRAQDAPLRTPEGADHLAEIPERQQGTVCRFVRTELRLSFWSRLCPYAEWEWWAADRLLSARQSNAGATTAPDFHAMTDAELREAVLATFDRLGLELGRLYRSLRGLVAKLEPLQGGGHHV